MNINIGINVAITQESRLIISHSPSGFSGGNSHGKDWLNSELSVGKGVYRFSGWLGFSMPSYNTVSLSLNDLK